MRQVNTLIVQYPLNQSPVPPHQTAQPSNYVLRLKKQTAKRSEISDLSDNYHKQKKEPFERSCSPLLATEDQIEVKKCESSTGSKFIIKGTRSNASVNTQCSTPPPIHPTINEDEHEPAEILRNRYRSHK